MQQAEKTHLSKKKKKQSFRGMRLGPRAAYMQISSKNKKKNHVNENLENTPYYVNWKNTPTLITVNPLLSPPFSEEES